MSGKELPNYHRVCCCLFCKWFIYIGEEETDDYECSKYNWLLSQGEFGVCDGYEELSR